MKERKRKVFIKWFAIVTCLALLLVAISHIPMFFNKDDYGTPIEIRLKFNDKYYSVIYTDKSPAYKNYNLEKNITADIIGDYLGEKTIRINDEGDKETFKIYRYKNAPITKYNWSPRLILENEKGKYYHAMNGSIFDEKTQTADEILSVYGLRSAKDIVSIENEKGKKITDPDFIEKFYNGLFTKEYGGDEFLNDMYLNADVDESKIDELYRKHADNTVFLKLTLLNGLVLKVNFTIHNYVEVDHSLYFKVGDDWIDLVSIFK